MKRYGTFFAGCLLGMLILSGSARAQGDPPGCCHSAKPLEEVVGTDDAAVTTVAVSNELLRNQGSNRSDLLDRLSSTLFLGKAVDVVMASTRLVSRSASAARGEALFAVRETRYYRVPRTQVQSEEIEALDQVYLTDGTSYVKVTFGSNENRRAQ